MEVRTLVSVNKYIFVGGSSKPLFDEENPFLFLFRGVVSFLKFSWSAPPLPSDSRIPARNLGNCVVTRARLPISIFFLNSISDYSVQMGVPFNYDKRPRP